MNQGFSGLHCSPTRIQVLLSIASSKASCTETAGGIISRVIFSFNVMPLFGRSMISDLLHTVSDKYMERTGIIGDISQDNFVVGPEKFNYIVVFKLLLKCLADSDRDKSGC